MSSGKRLSDQRYAFDAPQASKRSSLKRGSVKRGSNGSNPRISLENSVPDSLSRRSYAFSRRSSMNRPSSCMSHNISVNDVIAGNLECKYDMWALPIDQVMKMSGALPDHQTLLSEGKLVRVNTDAEARPVLFISHQWVAWDSPDPQLEQFRVLQEAFRNVLDGLEVSLSPIMKTLLAGTLDTEAFDYTDELKSVLKDCLVWFDFFSIPQPTSKLAADCKEKTVTELNKAVDSIPYYIAMAEHFIVLAPPVVHRDTKQLCDATVYKGRGWCRLEMVVWKIVAGECQSMVFATGPKSLSVSHSAADRLAVGDGEFTCCTRFEDHTYEEPETGRKIKIPCDKDKIGRVLVPLQEAFMEVLRESGKLEAYRTMKANWKNICTKLDVSMASKYSLDLPTTWMEFCEQYMLPDHLGMQLTNEQLQEFKCLPHLFYAVWSGNPEIVALILESTANPNFAVGANIMIDRKSLRGQTALHMAASHCRGDDGRNSDRILHLLFAAKADPYYKSQYALCPIATAINVQNDFFRNWFRDHHGRLDCVRAVDRFANTLLHLTAAQGDLHFLRDAYARGADFNVKNHYGSQPPHQLCRSPADINYRYPPVEVFKFLLDRGIVTNIDVTMDPPLTPGGMIFRLREFVFRMSYRIRRSRGPKALAAMHPVARLFAAANSASMLHILCYHGGSIELMEFLIEKKADIHHKNAMGMTALDLAIDQQHVHHQQIMRKADPSSSNPKKKIPWSRILTCFVGRSNHDITSVCALP
eukprot:gene1010-581_t